MDIVFWFSAAILVVTAIGAIDAAIGLRRIGELAAIVPQIPADAPTLSIIIPARNEATTIEPALRSIMALKYPALEVVAIDDRSTDATGAILDRLAAEFPTLQVIHVKELPPGWLGKTHALHVGAGRAAGDYLLFTDADVHYEPTALARAIGYARARDLAHLTIFPDVPLRSALLQCGAAGSVLALLMMHRPWRARDGTPHKLGIGAFNLVRASAYRIAGGHASIPMEIIDDIELGRLMGEHGRQDMLFGMRMISVEIYRSIAEMLGGLQKNMFAFVGFSGWILLAVSLGTLALSVWPWIGAIATEGATRWINVATLVFQVSINGLVVARLRYRPWCLVFMPLNALLTIGLFWQIAITTWARRGVIWRGTYYPLDELRRHKRR